MQMQRLSSSKLAQIALLVLIPLVWLGLVVSLALPTFFSLLDHAQAATQHIQDLQQNLRSLNTQTLLSDSKAAQNELDQLRSILDDTNGDLNYFQNEFERFKPLIDLAKLVTPFRADLETGQYLIQSSQALLKAGQRGLDAAKVAVDSLNNISTISIIGLDDLTATTPTTTDPAKLNSSQGGLIDPLKLEEIQDDLRQINTLVDQGVAAFNQIPYAQLKPGATLTKVVDQLRDQIPTLSTGLEDANKGLAIAERLLGFDEPANYYLVLQDADELRPTGALAGIMP